LRNGGALVLPLFLAISAQASDVDRAELAKIGQKVFQNECAGHIECLTSWNAGEDFASMGIGHFIWYPQGVPDSAKRFDESFPALIRWMVAQELNVPAIALQGCPWNSRESFLAAQQAESMQQLRYFLQQHMDAQVAFMQERLEASLPRIMQAAPEGKKQHLKANYHRIAVMPMGHYALLDYVNFKGEGVKPSERYQGQGWGLMQVLLNMDTRGDAMAAFVESAQQVLAQRVRLSPPERQEIRWLSGWEKRLQTYRISR